MIGRPALLPLDATLIEGYWPAQPQQSFSIAPFEWNVHWALAICREGGTLTNGNDPAPYTPPPESSGTIREEAENNY